MPNKTHNGSGLDREPSPLKDIPRGSFTAFRRRMRQILLVLIAITAVLLILAAIFS